MNPAVEWLEATFDQQWFDRHPSWAGPIYIIRTSDTSIGAARARWFPPDQPVNPDYPFALDNREVLIKEWLRWDRQRRRKPMP